MKLHPSHSPGGKANRGSCLHREVWEAEPEMCLLNTNSRSESQQQGRTPRPDKEQEEARLPLHEAVADAQMRKHVLTAAVLQAAVGIPKVGKGGWKTSAENNSRFKS